MRVSLVDFLEQSEFSKKPRVCRRGVLKTRDNTADASINVTRAKDFRAGTDFVGLWSDPHGRWVKSRLDKEIATEITCNCNRKKVLDVGERLEEGSCLTISSDGFLRSRALMRAALGSVKASAKAAINALAVTGVSRRP